MSDTKKRLVLATLSRADVILLGKAFGLPMSQRLPLDELLKVLETSGRAQIHAILPQLPDASLAKIGKALGIAEGQARDGLIAAIRQATGDAPAPVPSPEAVQMFSIAGTNAPAAVPEESEAPAPEPPAPKAGKAADVALTIDVEPRKPRLAWQGMDRRERAVSVPSQVVEVVRAGRAVDRGDSLLNTEARAAGAGKAGNALPPNRLIWTNDNLVALTTLLQERDAVTKDYKYQGKVDLIYIDPPFMVNSDFRADNTIDIDIDGDAGVQATKEPSLVEILAYKDTWRQGLDSFLTMLRTRLELLKKLLAPAGSIYVHLDWHAAHYVKVVMDEVFGYENFQTEIVWKRTSARAGTAGINHIHDVILSYGATTRPYAATVYTEYDADYVRDYYTQHDSRGRYQGVSLTAPGTRQGETGLVWRGFDPNKLGRHWAVPPAELDRLDADDRILWPERGGQPRLKQYLHEMSGVALQSIWMDVPTVNSQAGERSGYPTQKPIALVERIINASCPPGGLVLDCFMGSGTICEAAERLGRRWIGIDNGKYAIHLARKRLIQLHGQPCPPAKPQIDYEECDACHNLKRKEKKQKSPGPFSVRPFTVENMGVYQRAEQWQDFQTQRSRYRDEMIKVFGGEPGEHTLLLHGRKGNAWVHVGPLDSPIASTQVWNIARDAARTDRKAVIILSADYDTVTGLDKDAIKRQTGVAVTIRAIPASAIEEVKRRIDLLRANPDKPIESMAVPAFYAPLSIVLNAKVTGKTATITLERCEVDIESFISSQRPVSLKPISASMTPAARKKAQAEIDKWTAREKELHAWLDKKKTWQKFVDFWAVDSNYGHRVGEDGKPIFENEWQSFRTRKGKGEAEELVFSAELTYRAPGEYLVAARVTDVFGNDGIATVPVKVG